MRVKIAILVALWLILAWRVGTIITGGEEQRLELAIFAVLAWIGGLVTKTLADLYTDWRRVKHGAQPAE